MALQTEYDVSTNLLVPRLNNIYYCVLTQIHTNCFSFLTRPVEHNGKAPQ